MQWKRALGACILFLLGISYFITLPSDSGSNFVTQERLLGVLIFHNPFVLGIYLVLALWLILGRRAPQRRKRL
ncbi:hypothetical protein HYZ97_01975 [Candidatus Pacearchaeota archaeon]|nr:hypothetical protein [Candidatus Pacearchaeota archaeon]